MQVEVDVGAEEDDVVSLVSCDVLSLEAQKQYPLLIDLLSGSLSHTCLLPQESCC